MPRNYSRIDDVKGLPLTPTEQRILNLLCSTGASNKQIAKALKTTLNTTATHMYLMQHKLGVNSKQEMIVVSWRKRYQKLEEELRALKLEHNEVEECTNHSIQE